MSVLPRFLTHNASLKLLALVGAIFLWAIVPGSTEGGQILSDVAVRVQVADPEWVQAGPPDPATVQVRLSGPTREIIRIAREGTTLRVPVERVTGPDTLVTLRRDWVALAGSPGVVVEELVPAAVRIAFEEAGSKAVPLTLTTRGSLPGDVALAAELGVNPVVARVRGPVRLLEELDSIPLLPLDLSEIRTSGIVERAVDTTGLGGLLVSPQRASVGVRVEPAAERRLSGLPVEVVNDPGFTVLFRPDSADVRLVGAPARLTGSGLGGIRVAVDGRLVSGLEPGESRRVSLAVVGLPDLLTARPVPDSVTVIRPLGSGEEGS